MMGDEQLSMFQAAQLKWLKRQVDNLQDEKRRQDSRPGIERELWSARDELNDYVNQLKTIGILFVNLWLPIRLTAMQ